MNECQCASMRPGIKTRPFPAMTWAFAFASTVIGFADIRSIVLPLINTLEGADSVERRTVEDPHVLKKRYPFWDRNARRLSRHFYVIVLPQAHLAKRD